MKINLLSSFAAGALITTSICSIVYLSSGSADASGTTSHRMVKKVELSDSQMIDKLAAAGYVVQKKSDFDKTAKNTKNPINTQNTKPTTSATTANTKKPASQFTVNVTLGMTAFDVGNILKKANIIRDPVRFEMTVHGKNVEKNLHPGSFVVNSGMTTDQIISIIFK